MQKANNPTIDEKTLSDHDSRLTIHDSRLTIEITQLFSQTIAQS